MSSHDRNDLEKNAEPNTHTTEASQASNSIAPVDKIMDSNNDCPNPPLELTATVSDPGECGQGNEDQQPDSLVRRVTTELGPPVVVPRLQRRGLLGQITLLAEVENPKTYSRRVKWFITFVVAMAAVVAPLGSSIIFRKHDPGDQEQTWSLENTNMSRPFFFFFVCSIFGRGDGGIQREHHNHQLEHRSVHAQHVHFPIMVVVIQ